MNKQAKPTYRYSVFGLTVQSDILLEELTISREATIDVKIRYKPVIAPPAEFLKEGTYHLTATSFFLDVPDIARYRVEAGQVIEVDPYEGAEIEAIKLFLLGSCMGVILHQRNILPMHGSVIVVAGEGILLTGHSGAGKSTTAHRFLTHGYQFVTDDVAATHIEHRQAIVAPAYGHQKLWADVLEHAPELERKRVNREVEGRTKYTVSRDRQFLNQPTPLRLIVELVPSEEPAVRMERVQGIEKVRTLMVHMYRNVYFTALHKQKEQFEKATELARAVRLIRLYRPIGKATEQEVMDTILKEVTKGVKV